jgi:hypothetical protein
VIHTVPAVVVSILLMVIAMWIVSLTLTPPCLSIQQKCYLEVSIGLFSKVIIVVIIIFRAACNYSCIR